MTPYHIIKPTAPKVPILLSVPHCGTDFPEEIRSDFVADMMAAPDDTDWYVDRLYNFVSEIGITMIKAKYSRWVIDLNRDPKSKPLYNDGRIITRLCTTTDFNGKAIYTQNVPDQDEISRRIGLYYQPYYDKVQSLLDDLKEEFGQVLLWDAHSIRQYVPTIQSEPFPDMILGSADETSASSKLITAALTALGNSAYGLNHNTPFKGGQITRKFGRPDENQHALQLEMNKILYMDDGENEYSESRANKMRTVLQQTMSELISTLA